MNCSDCYAVQFTSCGTIDVNVGLDPNTTYYVWLYDHMNNVYVDEVTTDGNGDFTLDTDDYPEGLFSSGSFILNISDNSITNSLEAFTIGQTAYNCVELSYITISLLSYILMEDGTYLLLENNQKIFME